MESKPVKSKTVKQTKALARFLTVFFANNKLEKLSFKHNNTEFFNSQGKKRNYTILKIKVKGENPVKVKTYFK